MSYMALYRKFRPQEFADVKGQDHIVTTLKNEIVSDRTSHAYLFTGTRGTGKTTMAKIFARAVNCEHRQEDGSPCGECSVCKSILSGSSMNVKEMDAASNNGVEDIRSLIEDTSYPPTEGRYKVYIIDEVHMLSTAAFNAFLKTLEEPPEYVIFILATTELHKIPITVLSRCQRYDFRRITTDVIAARLRELLDAEGIEAEDRAVDFVARSADGSMRDGISLLDQCIAFYLGKKLTYEDVISVLGAVDMDTFAATAEAIRLGDAPAVIDQIRGVVDRGRDLAQFCADLTWYFRNLLLIHTDKSMVDSMDVAAEIKGSMLSQASDFSSDMLMRDIRLLSELTGSVRQAAAPRVVLEVGLIRLCKPEMESDNSSLASRMDGIERKIEKGVAIAPAASQQGGTWRDGPPPDMVEEKRPLPDAVSEDIEKLVANWDMVVSRVGAPISVYLRHATPTLSDSGQLQIFFDDGGDGQGTLGYDSLRPDMPSRKQLQEAFDEAAGAHVDFTVEINRSATPSDKRFESIFELEKRAGELGIPVTAEEGDL